MGLPNAERAEVDPRKITEYCLSPTHPVGKHKALVFRAALGITAAGLHTLRADQLIPLHTRGRPLRLRDVAA